MTETPVATAAAPERLNLAYHAFIGLAMGIIAPFTGLAWPLAILTGMVIGRANVERAKGIRANSTTQIVRVLAVTGGVLGMMVFGALIGGIVAFFIAALAAYSERLASGTSPTDQTMARIVITVIAIVVWIVLINVLKINVSFNFGGTPAAT